jgi:drug/metabolite transporter (DMT)-like permease
MIEKQNSFQSFSVLENSFINKPLLLRSESDFEKTGVGISHFQIFSMVFAQLTYSISAFFCKYLMDNYPSVTTNSLSLYRGIYASFIAYYFLKQENITISQQISVGKKAIPHLILRCIFSNVSNTLLIVSFTYISMPSAITVRYTFPIIVSIFNNILGLEKLFLKDYCIFGLCFIGIILIVNPPFLQSTPSEENYFGYFITFFATILLSVSFLFNPKINEVFKPNAVVFGMGIAFILQYVCLIPFYDSNQDREITLWILILQSIQSICFYLFLLFLTFAFGKKVSKIILCLCYTCIVFSYILDVFFFNKDLYFHELIGSMMIILLSIYRIMIK